MSFCTVDNEYLDIDLYDHYFDNGWSFIGDVATHDSCNDGTIYKTNIPIQIGKSYKVDYDVLTYFSGEVHFSIGSVGGSNRTSVANYIETVVATSGVEFSFFSDGDLSIRLNKVTELAAAGNGITIAYNEKKKSFSSFYSYIPERMVDIVSNFLTFKGGKIYLHNSPNNGYNSFYGDDPVPSELVAVVNADAAIVKTFMGIFINSNSQWQLIPTSSGNGIETNNGQVSNLISEDFNIADLGSGVFITKKEGVYYADFYRDTTSPGGLIEGDVLNGNWIKIRLTNDDNNFVSLWSVFINAVI